MLDLRERFGDALVGSPTLNRSRNLSELRGDRRQLLFERFNLLRFVSGVVRQGTSPVV